MGAEDLPLLGYLVEFCLDSRDLGGVPDLGGSCQILHRLGLARRERIPLETAQIVTPHLLGLVLVEAKGGAPGEETRERVVLHFVNDHAVVNGFVCVAETSRGFRAIEGVGQQDVT